MFTYVKNSKAELRENKFYIEYNELYGLYTGTEPQDYISAGIKLFGCSNTSIGGNKIEPSYALGEAGHGVIITREGLYVENSTISMDYSEIQDVGNDNDQGYSLVSSNSSVLLSKTTISYSNHIGIYSLNTSLRLDNTAVTKIENAEIYSENSSIEILNNSNLSETYGYGLYAINSTADIENSTFYHQMNWSIWLSGSKGAKIAGNLIDNSTHGIYYGESDVEAEITGNTISNHSYIEWTTQYLDSTPIFIGTPVGYGIYINNSLANISHGNEFLYNAYGTYFHNSTGKVVGDTFRKSLYNITILEIYRTHAPKGGEYITLEGSHDISVVNNEFSDAYRAITASSCQNLDMEKNTIGGIYVAASFKDTSGLDFKENSRISGENIISTTGISLENTDGYVVFNEFENFTYGVRIADIENMEIGHNVISNNEYGILIEGRVSTPSTIQHNEISHNTEGIHLSSTAHVAIERIFNNNIEHNTDYGAYNANSGYTVDMSYN